MDAVYEYYDNMEMPPPNTRPLITRTATINETEPTGPIATLETALSTYINENGIPQYIAMPTGNAASSNVLGSSTVHAAGLGGLGGLGTVTVLIMLYNLCAGAGFGVLLWKVSSRPF